jgi:hypothetical protein
MEADKTAPHGSIPASYQFANAGRFIQTAYFQETRHKILRWRMLTLCCTRPQASIGAALTDLAQIALSNHLRFLPSTALALASTLALSAAVR